MRGERGMGISWSTRLALFKPENRAALYRRACAEETKQRLFENSKLTTCHAAWVRRPCVWDSAEARQRVPDARVAAQGALLKPPGTKTIAIPC